MQEARLMIATAGELQQGDCLLHGRFGRNSKSYEISIGGCILENIVRIDVDQNDTLNIWVHGVDEPTQFNRDEKVLIVKTMEGLNP